MARLTRSRYAIFVHDPDGDMGYGRIVGPFLRADQAETKADAIRRAAVRAEREIECIIVPVAPGTVSARDITGAVLDD